jgi:hypothetical protein
VVFRAAPGQLGGAQRLATGQAKPGRSLNPTFSEPEVREMQDRIVNEAPKIQFDPDDDLETRVRKALPATEWVEREYGYPADLTIGLMIAENGLGAKESGGETKATRGNNYFSIQANPAQDRFSNGLAPGQTSWAGYPTINHAYARKMGLIAHPENTYNTAGARTWENRRNGTDAILDNLIKGKYIVEEPNYTIADWRRSVKSATDRVRRIREATRRP